MFDLMLLAQSQICCRLALFIEIVSCFLRALCNAELKLLPVGVAPSRARMASAAPAFYEAFIRKATELAQVQSSYNKMLVRITVSSVLIDYS